MRASTDVRIFEDTKELATAGAGIVADIAAEVAANRARRFSIALAGGSTPRRLYEELASIECVRWDAWEVFWSDERWVAADDPESNYRMARESFLTKVDIPDEQVHPVPTDMPSLAEAAESYSRELIRVVGPDPAIDLVLLGLGADGHTASLFPGTSALEVRDVPVIAARVPHLPTHRITLSFRTINRASHVMFVVAGAEKASMVRQALESRDDETVVPAARARPRAGSLHWLLDRSAASQLAPRPAVSK